MSYDLISYIGYEEKPDLEERIIAFFKRYGFNISLHPEFDLLKTSGLNPIFVRKDSKFWKRFPNAPDCDVITGHEWFISDLRKENPVDQKTGVFDKIKSFFHKEPEHFVDTDVTHVCISTSRGKGEVCNHVISCVFSVAIADIFNGKIENIHDNYDVPHKELHKFMEHYLNSYFQYMNPESMLRFKEWYDGQLDFGRAYVDGYNEEMNALEEYKLWSRDIPLSLLYPSSRINAIFKSTDTQIQSIYCIKVVPANPAAKGANVRSYPVLIGKRKDFSQEPDTNGLFDVSIPIKKVELTNVHRTIIAEGVYGDTPIGFKIQIPLDAEELLGESDSSSSEESEDSLKMIIIPPAYKSMFISLGEPTKNLFNTLGIGNFKKIKPSVNLVFINLIGDMNAVNHDCESEEEQVMLEYSTSEHGRKMKDGDLRFKIATYYDDDETHKFIKGEEEPQELEFLIDIVPSEKRLHFLEENTANRNNLKYTFMDYKK